MAHDEPGEETGGESGDSAPDSGDDVGPDPPEADDLTAGEETPSAAADAQVATDTAESPLAPDEAYCSNCGSEIDADAEICPDCGVRQQSGGDEKNAGVSFIASLVIPGAGQVYNDQVVRGIAMFLGASVMDLFIFFIAGILTFIVIGPLFLFFIPVVHVGVAYDAYTQAEKINRGEITP